MQRLTMRSEKYSSDECMQTLRLYKDGVDEHNSKKIEKARTRARLILKRNVLPTLCEFSKLMPLFYIKKIHTSKKELDPEDVLLVCNIHEEKYKSIKPYLNSLKNNQPTLLAKFLHGTAILRENYKRKDSDAIYKLLQRLVPSYWKGWFDYAVSLHKSASHGHPKDFADSIPYLLRALVELQKSPTGNTSKNRGMIYHSLAIAYICSGFAKENIVNANHYLKLAKKTDPKCRGVESTEAKIKTQKNLANAKVVSAHVPYKLYNQAHVNNPDRLGRNHPEKEGFSKVELVKDKPQVQRGDIGTSASSSHKAEGNLDCKPSKHNKKETKKTKSNQTEKVQPCFTITFGNDVFDKKKKKKKKSKRQADKQDKKQVEEPIVPVSTSNPVEPTCIENPIEAVDKAELRMQWKQLDLPKREKRWCCSLSFWKRFQEKEGNKDLPLSPPRL